MNEHIAAAQGTFMESLEESRHAADEDHTEVMFKNLIQIALNSIANFYYI